MAIIAINSY